MILTLLTTRNLFSDNSLQFVVRYDETCHHEPVYFHQVVKNNPYSTILFHHFVQNSSEISIVSRLDPLVRSQKQLVTFLQLNDGIFREYFDGIPVHYVLQSIVIAQFNPSYLLQHSEDPWNPRNYWYYQMHSGTSKLILFNSNNPKLVLVPSIPSSLLVHPFVVRVVTKDISLSKLSVLWYSLNSNLLMQNVRIDTTQKLENYDCRVHVSNLNKSTTAELCRILFLSKTLNFSIAGPESHPASQISFFQLQSIFDDGKLGETQDTTYVFKWVEKKVKFSIVTHRGSESQGMYAFLSPFTRSVWVTLFLFCIIVTVLVQLSKKDEKKFGFGAIDDFFMVTAILLSQTNGDSLKLFRGRNMVAAPILTVWYLAGGYIIANNLYTGEIFSSLTATKRPIVPTTLEELVDSNLPIITTGGHTSKADGYQVHSTLKTSTIPSFVQNFESHKEFVKLCFKLNDQLKFINIHAPSGQIQQFLTNFKTSKVLTSSNISVKVDGTFALMDYTKQLEFFTELIRIYEGRLVIDGKSDNTPFTFISADFGYKNFLMPIFRRTVSHLETMGVEERWKLLQRRKVIAIQLYDWKNPLFKWYFSRQNFINDRLPQREAIPMSVEPIKVVFILCVTFLFMALMVFLVESGGILGRTGAKVGREFIIRKKKLFAYLKILWITIIPA